MAGPWEDYQQAQPAHGPWEDYSAPTTEKPSAPVEKPSWLDQEVPLTSTGAAFESGGKSILRGIRDAGEGLYNTVRHPVDTAKAIGSFPSAVAQVPAAIHDINQSSDPLGTYAKVGQETSGQGAGQALMAIGAEAAPKIPGAISRAIPTTAKAGKLLETVKGAAGAVPVDVGPAGNIALETQEMAGRGGQLPKVMRDFIRRTTDPTKGPVTYSELRDFASNAGRLSVDETNRLTPAVQRQAARFAKALGDANKAAAESVGQGENYTQGMSQYSKAIKLRNLKDNVIEAGKKPAITGAIGGAGYGLYKGIAQ